MLLELNDPTFDPVNRGIAPELVRECERDGTIAPGIWMTRDFTAQMARAAIVQTGAQVFSAEGEIPAQMLVEDAGSPGGMKPVPNPQAQDWVDLAFYTADLGIDLAVATSWAPFQKYVWEEGRWLLRPAPEFAKPLTDDGWYVQPYVYPAETPTHSVAAAKAYAQNFPEWAGTEEPVLGTYAGQFGDFRSLASAPFNGKDTCVGWSVWDAGEQF